MDLPSQDKLLFLFTPKTFINRFDLSLLSRLIAMSRKDKPKKISAKKEKYVKFKKDKPGTLDISMPEISDEERKQARNDEEKINKHLRFSKNRPPSEINPRKAKSKR